MDPITGSLIGAGISQIGNWLGGNAAHKRDRQEALDDWNRNNEYNAPAAQMQRFKDAGLNPQLIYGQGTPGNASATPVSTQKSGNYDYKTDLQSIYGDAKRLEANMQQVQQTVENLKTNQQLMQANTDLAKQLNEQRGEIMPFKLDEYNSRINNLNSQAQWRTSLVNPTITNLENRTKIDSARNDREERLLRSNLSINNTREQEMRASTALSVQNRLKAVQDTLLKTTQNTYESKRQYEQLELLRAQTLNIIQGRSTSMSVEQLNRTRDALTELQNGTMSLNNFLNIIKSFK
ncbi:MAG: DNA pilot protein [Microvirus sp.]|nr:MAG: DNA pilot protein [Microvirus sp.]